MKITSGGAYISVILNVIRICYFYLIQRLMIGITIRDFIKITNENSSILFMF